MSADVVSLVTRLPIRSALEVTKVEAGSGVVFLTVIDGHGDPVEVQFTIAEARRHVALVNDAVDVAEGIARG